MDIPVGTGYFRPMFGRVIIMLATFAVSVMTAATSAQAARMSVMPDHATHVGEMAFASGNNDLSCDGEHLCGSADGGMCEFVCTGLSAFLTSPDEQSAQECGGSSHDIPSRLTHAGRAPGLDERPPRLRLL